MKHKLWCNNKKKSTAYLRISTINKAVEGMPSPIRAKAFKAGWRQANKVAAKHNPNIMIWKVFLKKKLLKVNI